MKADTTDHTIDSDLRTFEDLKKAKKIDKGSLHFAKTEMIIELKQKVSSNFSVLEAEDTLIYGMNLSYLTMKQKIIEGVVYIKPNDENILMFLNVKKKETTKINLYKLSDFTFGKNSGNFKLCLKLLEKCNENFCLTIHLNNLKYFDFIFKSQKDLELFLLGIATFMERSINKSKELKSDFFTLKKIWKEYDVNHNKFLNCEQFSSFLTNINFTYKNKSFSQIFKEIDVKNEGKIIFKDFIYFYESIVTGEEFKEIFQKYSFDPEKKYITMRGIMDFCEKEQHVKMSVSEIFEIITKFSKKTKKLKQQILDTKNIKSVSSNNNIANINTDQENINEFNNQNKDQDINESMLELYENHSFGKNFLDNELGGNIYSKNNFTLSFRDFVNFLMDKSYNLIIDQKRFGIHMNMNYPMNDYFIYSSHNTYLTGNQMYGNSSLEMYKHLLKNGCRLIEFDCWDSKNGPIITHWHFPVNKLDFKEVLISVKEYAFKKSEFPVIISVENHCSPVCQDLMQIYFIEVLGYDNLYILDPQNPPLQYPSPNELKRKFIIKCKRKRIFGNFSSNLNVNNNYHNINIKKQEIENENNYFGKFENAFNNNNNNNHNNQNSESPFKTSIKREISDCRLAGSNIEEINLNKESNTLMSK